MGDVFSTIHPGVPGRKGIEFVWSDLLPIILEGLSSLIDFKRKVTGHDDKGLETFVRAAEEGTSGAVAAVANVGEALRINIIAGEKEVGAATEVHVLLYFHRDLLLVQRCT